MCYVRLPERGAHVAHALGLWARLAGVVKVLFGYG